MRRYTAIDSRFEKPIENKHQSILTLIWEIDFTDREINKVLDLYPGEKVEWKKDKIAVIREK